jgi:L-lactate utilization protein LutC
MNYAQLANPEAVARTVTALREHNIETEVVADRHEALARLQALIPEGSDVMVGTSTTLDQIGFTEWLRGEPGVRDLRARVRGENDAAARAELRRRAATADVMAGSVHAISETGEVVVLSRTGSQMGPYLAARRVLWVAGTQKIVPTLEEAMRRATEYVTPLEDARMKAIGAPGTRIGKMLIFHSEVQAGRITLILVPEVLGF